MTEEQILAAHVGEKRPHNAQVRLADYDPAWPAVFARHAERITRALGDRALMIEHVGSTSVPGLAAKPTIDILLVVADSANEGTYLDAMEAEGYELRVREPEWHEHRMFADLERTTQVHVLSEGNAEIERYLLFRDRLRTNQADRELYERTKRELAKREWKYVQNYADAKGPVVEKIIARARAAG
ncbi:MAG TPA: GrpB family protein [Actinomycetota bacterium]|nr:GrpB family protein [Actinomycetota bacterium]